MRKLYCIFTGLILCIILLLLQSECFSQIEEEKQERVTQIQMLQKKPASYSLTSSVALFSGYDNNVKLSPVRKGSIFEEFLYSLDFDKPLCSNFRFSFNYDLDYLYYNDTSSSSNLMNHLRFGLHKKLNRFFTTGVGYDFSDFYYPNNASGDFLFNKGFLYLKNFISDTIFHQLTLEYGYKIHPGRKALSDSITDLQDHNLVDRRQGIEYAIGSNISSRLFLQLKTNFSKNESNAKYLDFYDYKSYEVSPTIDYKLSEKFNLVWSFAYLRKDYTSRTISTGTKKEKDDVFATNLGVRCRLNKNSIVSLFYTYRDNSTNEPLEKYTENVFTCGWEYNF